MLEKRREKKEIRLWEREKNEKCFLIRVKHCIHLTKGWAAPRRLHPKKSTTEKTPPIYATETWSGEPSSSGRAGGKSDNVGLDPKNSI